MAFSNTPLESTQSLALIPRLAPTETQKAMLLFQSLELLRHEVLHLLYVHAPPALWKCPYRSALPDNRPFSLSCSPSMSRHRMPVIGLERDTEESQQRNRAYVILGLQVPGLLAQEAKDIGEVLISDLIKHL